LGVTYKADTGDPRQSPATKVMELLHKEGALLTYVDPHTESLQLGDVELSAKKLSPSLLAECHCALILTAHSAFDYDLIVKHAPIVFDTRNGTRNVQGEKWNVILL